MDRLRAETAQGLVWAAIQRVGGQATSLVAFILLTRLLAPEDLGLAAMGFVYLSLALAVLEQGIGSSIIQFPDLQDEHIDSAFWRSATLGLLLTVATILLAEPVAGLFREPDLAPVLVGLAPALALAGLRNPQMGLMQRAFRFRELAVRAMVAEAQGV